MTTRLIDSVRRQWLGVSIALVALLVAAGAPGYAAQTVQRALFAKKAGNAKKVGGIKASRTPAAGKLLPLGADMKLPASVVPTAASVIRFADLTSNGAGNVGHVEVFCQPGERATGGGIGWTQSPGGGDAITYSGPEDADGITFPAQGSEATGWAGEIRTSDGAGKTGRIYVVCTR